MEIKKLADIIEWADNWIKELKDGLTEEEFTEYIEDGEVRDFETVKKVVLESMERQTVYSNALNMDIAAKAAKIELMEKEIEGRKEGYTALKELMDTKYISIEEHNKIVDQFKEEVKKLNKCIMNKNESINTANDAIVNLRKEIGAHEEESKKLENRIKELKKERDKHIIDRNATIMQLENQVKYLKKELEQTCTTKELDLKNHQKRDIALVDELAKKNDEIKRLKESIEELKNLNRSLRKTNDELVDTLDKSSDMIEELESGRVDTDFVNKLIQETDYYKNQERIRTDQLRATESKVEELYKRIEGLKRANRIVSNIASALTHKEDDHGKSGFKRYIEHLIEEEERAVPERFKERLNKEITAIFTKEEETEVKGVGRTNSGRYPWGAKVNDIPCGEDAIE